MDKKFPKIQIVVESLFLRLDDGSYANLCRNDSGEYIPAPVYYFFILRDGKVVYHTLSHGIYYRNEEECMKDARAEAANRRRNIRRK